MMLSINPTSVRGTSESRLARKANNDMISFRNSATNEYLQAHAEATAVTNTHVGQTSACHVHPLAPVVLLFIAAVVKSDDRVHLWALSATPGLGDHARKQQRDADGPKQETDDPKRQQLLSVCA
jgi:hypothetical protein